MANISAFESSKTGNLKAFVRAIKNGEYEYFEYLHNAVVYNHINIIKYMIKKNLIEAQEAGVKAIQYGRWEIFSYIIKTYEYDMITYYDYILAHNRSDFLKNLESKIKQLNQENVKDIYKKAAQYGHDGVFAQLYSFKLKIDDKLVLKYILKNGRFELFKLFTEETKQKYLTYSINLSIKYGYITIMKWIFKNIKYDNNIVMSAIEFAKSKDINRMDAVKTLKKYLQ